MKSKRVSFVKLIPYVFGIIMTFIFLVPVAAQKMNANIASYSVISSEHIELSLKKHEDGFSENSIAQRLIPTTLTEVVYMAPMRFVAYIVAPLNIIWTGISGEFTCSAVQRVSNVFTSIVILFGTAVFVRRRRMYKNTWQLFKPYLIFSVVALFIISNIIMILHTQYRVFALLPFCVYLIGFFVVKQQAKMS